MTTRSFGIGLVLAFGPVAAASLCPTPGRADEAPRPTVIDVWPGDAPGEIGKIDDEKETRKEGKVTSLTNVTKPTLSVHRPADGKNTGVAVLVFPGGGYNNLAWDHEGDQVATWLNSIGVTAAVLKYRVPRRPGSPQGEPPVQALMDAQRAVSIVRSKAADWGVDPKKVGVLGFSAGGHLGAWVSTNADKRAYAATDRTDEVSDRPDFAILVYPGGVIKRGGEALAPEIRVTSETPPMFLAHAGDDRVSAENSVQLYLALKRAGVPAELHIYAKGGHGFGLRPSANPSNTWPRRAEEWLKSLGVLTSRSS